MSAQVDKGLLSVLSWLGLTDTTAWYNTVAANAVAFYIDEIIATYTLVDLIGIVVPLIPCLTNTLTVAQRRAPIITCTAGFGPRALQTRAALAGRALECFFIEPETRLAFDAGTSGSVTGIAVSVIACQAFTVVISARKS